MMYFSCTAPDKGNETFSTNNMKGTAENKTNRVSPPLSATDTIGGNIVTIQYGSPRVKGRVIWGGLVPYDTVWRTGANEATTIAFTKDVLINGQPLKKDTYALFSIPGREEWQIIFSINEKQWGAFKYKESEDALRIKVTPTALDSLVENMTFIITPDSVSLSAANVALRWEKLQVGFRFENVEE
jgi:hypothetical protein